MEYPSGLTLTNTYDDIGRVVVVNDGSTDGTLQRIIERFGRWLPLATAVGLLALAISAVGKTGNGVQLYDPATGVLRVLDSSPAIYSGLVWRRGAADLAAFRAKTRIVESSRKLMLSAFPSGAVS